MNGYLDDNFFLENATAVTLYHRYAKDMPIFDYHCHLSPAEIAQDRQYDNLAQLWLSGDHYKWRAMRQNGADERYITGDADDKEKFLKWAETLPYCLGNPLYVWSHLELRRYFGVTETLSPATAEAVWETCNRVIQGSGFSARALIGRSNVTALCTTDNPADTLEAHRKIRKDGTFQTAVLPTFRPDPFLNIEKADFGAWIKKLSAAAQMPGRTLGDLTGALERRMAFFHENGGRRSAHALDPRECEPCGYDEAEEIFQRAAAGGRLDATAVRKYKSWLLLFLGRAYARYGWVMQLHIGTERSVSDRRLMRLGPDTGFDAAGDDLRARALRCLLNSLDKTGEVPKIILYSLNPGDYEVLLTVGGSFAGDVPGKIQLGSAWWFNDHRSGIEKQLTACANLSLLGRFIGMTTDSRSFLSYTRHEYFRRVLCNLLGKWIESGELPRDIDLLGETVQNICYHNAARYFGLDDMTHSAMH
jgi:glucuronate isomerase